MHLDFLIKTPNTNCLFYLNKYLIKYKKKYDFINEL